MYLYRFPKMNVITIYLTFTNKNLKIKKIKISQTCRFFQKRMPWHVYLLKLGNIHSMYAGEVI